MPSSDSVQNFSPAVYPRTGKRGVPQQFPRRLYEMLESEAKLAPSSAEETYGISWSESGKAFRIMNVEAFANTILPRYFRTKKFSSFQRNLNLYGFAKVRRGPDTDMYAHPSFLRGHPDLLCELRKCTSSSRRRLPSKGANDDSSTGSAESHHFRSISPSPPSTPVFDTVVKRPPLSMATPYLTQSWVTFGNSSAPQKPPEKQSVPERDCRGKLDLLALAIEHESCLTA